MTNQTTLQKILRFFLTKIIIGVMVVAGSVALIEWLGRLLLDKTQLSDDLKNLIIGIIESFVALLSYILLFRFYEKRKIKELGLPGFLKNALIGFLTGFVLQSLIVLVIYLTGDYSIKHINPLSFLLPAFSVALTAGFVAEILIRGIIFRLTEEKLGTITALIMSALLFAVIHSKSEGATILSVITTAIQAGILLSAVYVSTQNLWFPIFLHFAWDFAEPGIYGAINPGISIDKSLLTIQISGSQLLTGGQLGPQNSIQSMLFCLSASILFLWLAKRKHNFIKPDWKR
jgi:membrane protease YdiL (CAAX protease family)